MSGYPKSDDKMSTASTLVSQPEVRTSLTGRPIKYEHDNLTNMLSGESWNVGANSLPPGYTDTSLVHIPIKIAQYLNAAKISESKNPIKREQPRKGSVFSKLTNKITGNKDEKDADEMKIVAMSRGDYLKYWAKGDDGKYRDDVVEPPEGRAEWLRMALQRQEREGFGKITTERRTKGTEGPASSFGAAGAMIGGVVN